MSKTTHPLISRIDELSVLWLTSIGYVLLYSNFDNVRTPETMDGFDNIRTDLNDLDDIKTHQNLFATPKGELKSLGEILDSGDEEALDTLKEAGQAVLDKRAFLNAEAKAMLKKLCDDDFIEYMMFAYEDGNEAANKMLAKETTVDFNSLTITIDAPTAGKTAIERVNEHIDKDELNQVGRVLDTEMHRVYNEAVLKSGKDGGARTKTWVTMLDDKVRDTHDYLEGMEVGIDEDFYTYDGDHARYPGDFGNAANNANCRCTLLLN